MKLARVTGLVTGTVKTTNLTGQKLLVVDLIDAKGKVQDGSVIVTDVCGAGHGDTVLVATGSAARLPAELAGTPTDATAVAIIDDIKLGG